MQEVHDCLRSGWAGTGPKVKRFEQEFADYVGARRAVAVSFCTAALHLSMIAANVRPGDEVVTTPLTFVATARGHHKEKTLTEPHLGSRSCCFTNAAAVGKQNPEPGSRSDFAMPRLSA
jgi:cystathionine beta-lyase/cystathionine gamma-synthase